MIQNEGEALDNGNPPHYNVFTQSDKNIAEGRIFMKKIAQIRMRKTWFVLIAIIGLILWTLDEQSKIVINVQGTVENKDSIHQEVISTSANDKPYLIIAPRESNPMQAHIEKLTQYPVEHLDYTCGAGRDYEILLRIVEAEAGGEDQKGKMLVANVIMNRIKSKEFPDTVEDVVYQTIGGYPQFSPTADGRIETVAVTEDTIEAVNLALQGEDDSQGAMYFMARKASEEESVSWFDTHLSYLFTWGGHDFYSENGSI